MQIERNGNKLGEWEYDVFITDEGNLGFTVYEQGKSGENEDTHSRGFFICNKDVLYTSDSHS